MKLFKNQFAEFKSIFFSEDLLKENERHANIVTASTMLNLFFMCVITWLLVLFRIFKVEVSIMQLVFTFSFFLLLLPSAFCFIKKGEGKFLKHLLFICFTILLALTDMILKYNVTLVMIIPIVLAARYYNKKFTLSIAIFTTLLFMISTTFSIHIGAQDLNTYNLVMPNNTVITINQTLREEIAKVKVDEHQRLINIFIHFFLPKMLVFNIAAFACAQISQSGKSLFQKQAEITKNGERIETELNIASAIQKSMLPSSSNPFPNHEEIDISAMMIPAKKIGGDFYDMFFIDEHHLAICIADVSGKGIPASLFMMISKILIKNIAIIEKDVYRTFERVNNILCDGNETNIFVTSFLGILDLTNGNMEFVNAGHNPPLFYSKKRNRFEYLRTKPNFILAGMKNAKYTKHEMKIETGDRLFLYTDGVVESNNIDHELYGENRLQDFLNHHLECSVEDTIKEVKKDVDLFATGVEQADDITMLELLYKNKNIHKKNFKADRSELPSVYEFVKKELESHKCSPKTIDQISLAIEEIFVNIADYAYAGKEGLFSLTIEFDGTNIFRFLFEDEGVPFNPLEKETPDLSLSAHDRKVGGLGIYITKMIMDDMKYEYKDQKNRLTLIIDTSKHHDERLDTF